MGNHTRKCSIAGCKKQSHGRGFCISHFSSGLINMPEDGLATGDCIAWKGRPEKFQAAAVRSVVLDGKEVPQWAWVEVNCGSERCLNSEHLDVHAPEVLRYPYGVCVYCGRRASTKDHILPRNWTGESVRSFTAIVPACGTCNSMLSDTLTPSINQRRAVAHARARRKYARLLNMPEWDEEQLHGVEGSLREYILDEVSKRAEVRRMLEWPADTTYDTRALERSGIEDPYEAGLLELETAEFHEATRSLVAN